MLKTTALVATFFFASAASADETGGAAAVPSGAAPTISVPIEADRPVAPVVETGRPPIDSNTNKPITSCSLLALVKSLQHLARAKVASDAAMNQEHEITRLMIARMADNPRIFDLLGIQRDQLYNLLVSRNVSGATQDMRLARIEMWRTYGLIVKISEVLPLLENRIAKTKPSDKPLTKAEKREVGILMDALRELRGQSYDLKLLVGAKVPQFGKVTGPPQLDVSNIREPTTKTEMIEFLKGASDYFVASETYARQHHQILVMVNLRYDRILETFAGMKVEESDIPDPLQRQRTIEAQAAAKAVSENNSFERFVTQTPDIFFGVSKPTYEQQWDLINSNATSRQSFAEITRVTEKAAALRSIFYRVAEFAAKSQGQIQEFARIPFLSEKNPWKDLPGRLIVRMTPLMKVMGEIASRNLYYEEHLPIINQMMPKIGAEASVEQVYDRLIQNAGDRGFMFVVNFFRANSTSKIGDQIQAEMLSRASIESRGHLFLINSARRVALEAGPLSTLRAEMTAGEKLTLGAQVVYALVLAIFVSSDEARDAALGYISDQFKEMKIPDIIKQVKETADETGNLKEKDPNAEANSESSGSGENGNN